jgi:adenylosuccinate lyase
MDWSERYSTPLNDVFSRQHKLELEWRVELALLKALGEVGLVPKEAHGEVEAVIKCEEEEEGERARAHARGAADAGRLRAAVRRVRGRVPRKALQRRPQKD